MDLGVSANVAPLLAEVKQFIDEEIRPVEAEYFGDIFGNTWFFSNTDFHFLRNLKDTYGADFCTKSFVVI